MIAPIRYFNRKKEENNGNKLFLKKSWLAALFHLTAKIDLDLLGQGHVRTFLTRHVDRLLSTSFQNELSQSLP